MDNRHMDESKTLWNMDRVITHFDKGEKIAPVHIDMGIAKFCNVNCVFCYGMYQNPSKNLIGKDALLQTMRDAGEIGVRSIGFIGDGEPLCNPHVYEALREGKDSGLDMALSTNGVLLNTVPKMHTVLDSTSWMRFCLAAGTREGYKEIHRVDKFQEVRSNIEMMVQEKRINNFQCDIGLQSVFIPNKIMAREVVAEAKLAVELGVDYFVVKQCSLPDEGQTGMMQFKMSDYDRPEIIDALKEAEALTTHNTKIVVKWNTMELKGDKKYERCPSIPLISEISGNGDWYPCGYFFGDKPQFEQYRFGNLHETSLKEMFESDKYWDVIKHMREEFSVREQCKGCCRQEHVNIFLDNYLNKPQGINFI